MMQRPSILLAEQLEYRKELEPFWKYKNSMTFLIVEDCWKRACEREQKDSEELLRQLHKFLDIQIVRNDHTNEEKLQQDIDYIRKNINEGQMEKDEDSTKELAYAMFFRCSELVTHKFDDFLVYKYDSLPVRIRSIKPKTEPESKTEPEPKTQKNPISLLFQWFRQWWSNVGFLKYLIYSISAVLISVSFSSLIDDIFPKPSPSVSDPTFRTFIK